MNIILSVNTILEWVNIEGETKYERILWIDLSTDQLVSIYLPAKKLPEWKILSEYEDALENGELIKLSIDPFVKLNSLSEDIPLKHLTLRDRAWEVIGDIVFIEPDIYISDKRGQLIQQVINKYGVRKKAIFKYLKRYWIGGKIKNALLPAYDKCGAAGQERLAGEKKRGRPSNLSKNEPEKIGVNITEQTKRIFEMGTNLYYNSTAKRSLKKTHKLILEKFFHIGFETVNGVSVPIMPLASEMPTYRQYHYWFTKRLDLQKTFIAREGEKGYQLRSRPILGSSNEKVNGPGSVYQIDATIPGQYIVSTYDRTQIIGKPVVYLVVDVFSRIIVGLYIGLEGPSWIGAMMALANTFLDKVSFCAEYGISIDQHMWPCKGLPETIMADRGEMEGFNADYLPEILGIAVKNAPPYRGDLKGIIEQKFNQMDERVINELPGAVKERYRERGEKDHRLEAILDLREFTKIIINMVIDYNLNHFIEDYSREEFMISDHLEPIPIKLWNWGIQYRSGHFREKSEDIVRMALMPKDEATITLRGIRFKGMYYSCKKALEEQWFQKARRYGNKTVKISYDPRRLNQIFILSDDGKGFETCELLPRENRYKHHYLEEVAKLIEAEKLMADKHRLNKPQTDAFFQANNDAIIKEAREKTLEAMSGKSLSDRQRVKSIKTNRAEEKERIREKEAWTANDSKEPVVDNLVELNTIDKELEVKTRSKRDLFLSILENQTKEQQ
jgi:putative transposase